VTFYTIDAQEARTAVGASKATWTRWIAHLPCERTFNGRWGGGGSTPKQFCLSDLVPAIRARRKGGFHGDALAALVALDTSRDDPSDHLGDDADARAASLHAAFTDDEKERVARVAKWAGQGATYALWGKRHLYDHGRALALLTLRPAVLAYILTGQRRNEFPTTRDAWGDYMAAHVVAVATPDEINKLAS
jgi:hypothetical protein